MSAIARLPQPPYYAVIFTSLRTEVEDGYGETGERMMALAAEQEGFLGVETAREGLGITVSYWRDLESIQKWRRQAEHAEAQRMGREKWYASYALRVAKVEYARDWVSEEH